MKIRFLLPLLAALKEPLRKKIDQEVNDGDDNYAIELQVLLLVIEAAEIIFTDSE